jgi:molybdopterin-guanine dinucleotide biosynthesis protein B
MVHHPAMKTDLFSVPVPWKRRRPPVVSFVGRSGSGKTRFLERLIPRLKDAGIAAGVIKHHAHEIDVDRRGKDTHRLLEAGAERVSLSGPGKNAYFEAVEGERPPETVVERFFTGLDLVLTEGFKRGPFPKIEVARRAAGDALITTPAEGLIAVVTDFEPEAAVPRFPLDDPGPTVEFLKERIMFADQTSQWNVTLRVDGKEIPIKEFVRDIFINVALGMADTLKGVPDQPDEMEITLKRG